MKTQKLNRRQAYWALYLSRFNFTLKHILGTKMGKTDKLSRTLDQKVGIENDNNNQTLIKKQQIYNLVKVVIEEQETEIVEKIKKARSKNKKVVKVVEKMKKVEVKKLRGEEWQIEGDLILKEGKVYIPKNKVLRMEIIQLHHDILVAEYGRRQKTMELVTRSYWWLSMTRNVGKYVEG